MGTRTVPVISVPVSPAYAAACLCPAGSDPAEAGPSSIRVDVEEETVDADASQHRFIGPLECKLIQGTDRRCYSLEMVYSSSNLFILLSSYKHFCCRLISY